MMDKHCPKCRLTKPVSEYYKKPRFKIYEGLAGYTHNCKACARASRREYTKANPLKTRQSDRNYLLSQYGLTAEAYNTLFTAQEGKCGGCSKHQSEFLRRLSVDHDHSTGKVRGLLCIRCNTVLGNALDSVEILKNLIVYLNKNSELTDQNINVVSINAAKKVG